MRIADITLLYDYNYWANRRILTSAAHISEEQLRQPTSFSWGSLRETLLHTLEAEYFWRYLLQKGRMDPDLLEREPFPTFDSIAAFWRDEEARMRDYLSRLSDDDMTRTVRYEGAAGVRERVLWHCLWQVLNHGTQHRSECAAMLTDYGHSPGDIDFTVYLNTLL